MPSRRARGGRTACRDRDGRQQREAGRRLGARMRRARAMRSLWSSGASPVRIATMRSSDSFCDGGQRALHGVTGAALLGLDRDVDRAGAEARVERGLHGFVLVAEDRDDALGSGRARRAHDPVQHRPTGDLVEDLGGIALHPRAEAGGHDEHDRGLTTHVSGAVTRTGTGRAALPAQYEDASGCRCCRCSPRAALSSAVAAAGSDNPADALVDTLPRDAAIDVACLHGR